MSRKDNNKKAERWRTNRNILDAIELLGFVKEIHEEERFLDAHYPEPRVILSETLPINAETKEILRRSIRALKEARVDAHPFGEMVTVPSYFSSVLPIEHILSNMRLKNRSEIEEQVSSIFQRSKELYPHGLLIAAAQTAVKEIEDVLIQYGRINKGFYSVELDYGWNEHRKWFVNFVIHWVPPEERQFSVGGKRRPAFRCGQPYDMQIRWSEIDSALLGTGGKQYPVYIQNHALRHLYERALFLENGEWLVHDYMWQSLIEPKITLKTDGSFLIEYCLHAHKLGYFVARIVDDVVLIITFKFLTMDGTPEGDLLWKKLRIARADKEYLKLDSIRTFLFSDVQHDAELCKILDECGCGHLFKIVIEPIPLGRCQTGLASDARRYLGIADK